MTDMTPTRLLEMAGQADLKMVWHAERALGDLIDADIATDSAHLSASFALVGAGLRDLARRNDWQINDRCAEGRPSGDPVQP
jgi:hypothetical protein